MLDVTGGQKKVSRVKETVVGQSLLLSRMLWWGGVWAEARVKGGTSPVSGVEEQCRGPDAGAPLDNCVETVSVKHPSVCREAPWLVPGGKHSRYLEFSENSIAHLAKGAESPERKQAWSWPPAGPKASSLSEAVNLSSGQVLPFSEEPQDSLTKYSIAVSLPCTIFTFRTGVMRISTLGFKQDTEIFSPRDLVGQRVWSSFLMIISRWLAFLLRF